MEQSPFLTSVRSFCRAKHYSLKTEKAYIHWMKRYINYHNKMHPTEMAEPEVEQFLTFIAQVMKVSPNTQNQALCALSFMYEGVLQTPLVDLPAPILPQKKKSLACIVFFSPLIIGVVL